MGIWRREDVTFKTLPADRQANIEVVSSAFRTLTGGKAYLTMPITTGRRYYDVLDRYGVKTTEELEQKRPGALRGEIIEPNLAEGKLFAEQLAPEINAALINPGAFEGRAQKWTQDEYMVLWLRLITSPSVKELYLMEGWEYSNGGAMEFARGLMIQFHFLSGREDRMPVFEHTKEPISIVRGATKLAEAIKDLGRRGYPTEALKAELGCVAGIAAFCYDYLTDRHEWEQHTDGIGFEWQKVVSAAESVKAPIAIAYD